MSNAYAVKHKATGLFFIGFAADMSPMWGLESQAKQFDFDGAKQQALLFASFSINVQKKPAAL